MNDKEMEKARRDIRRLNRECVKRFGMSEVKDDYFNIYNWDHKKWWHRPKELATIEAELSAIDMINSVACYAPKAARANAEALRRYERNKYYDYLQKYEESVGATKLMELIANQLNDIEAIKYNVGRDGEGVTYNSIVWKE